MSVFGVDVCQDDASRHPTKLCTTCSTFIKRATSAGPSSRLPQFIYRRLKKTMAQHVPLFELLFDEHYCLLLTLELTELLGLLPASPGEIYGGWAVESLRGLPVFRGGHLTTICIIIVSVSTLLFSQVQRWSTLSDLIKDLPTRTLFMLMDSFLLFTVKGRRSCCSLLWR